MPNHSLCAFTRVFLEAGESRELTVPISGQAFLVVDEEGAYVRGSGSYVLYVGMGQPDERTAALSGKRCVEVPVN